VVLELGLRKKRDGWSSRHTLEGGKNNSYNRETQRIVRAGVKIYDSLRSLPNGPKGCKRCTKEPLTDRQKGNAYQKKQGLNSRLVEEKKPK